MSPDQQQPDRTVVQRPVVRSPIARIILWVFLAPTIALAAIPLLRVAAPGWIGFAWLVAVFWPIGAGLVLGVRAVAGRGGASSFHDSQPPDEVLGSDDDDFDYFTRTGSYAHLRIRAEHEALMRESDSLLDNLDHSDSLR